MTCTRSGNFGSIGHRQIKASTAVRWCTVGLCVHSTRVYRCYSNSLSQPISSCSGERSFLWALNHQDAWVLVMPKRSKVNSICTATRLWTEHERHHDLLPVMTNIGRWSLLPRHFEGQDEISSEASAFQREEVELAKPFLIRHVTETSH